MSTPFVAVLMGSDSDLPTMQATLDVLESLSIPYEVKITSAHRTPDAAAGLAAHLAGTVAGLTIKPVIGVPMEGGPLKGEDALLSTVMMPGGIPVATVAIGKAGAKNAAYLAGQMIALCDKALAERIKQDRDANAQAVIAKDAELQQKLAKKS
jgi:5-(carboxyamino)imidazole ribonucleotide mutase